LFLLVFLFVFLLFFLFFLLLLLLSGTFFTIVPTSYQVHGTNIEPPRAI
jgi:hypothetical protein